MCSDVCSSSLWFSLMYIAWIPNIPPGRLLTHRMYSTCFLVEMHIFYQNTHSVYLLVRWCIRCCISINDGSVNLSISSTSHLRAESRLIARYSWTKACRFPDVWSSANSSLHCCCGSSLNLSSVFMSLAPMTSCWNKMLMTFAGLTPSTTLECSFLNLSFNTSFDSTENLWRILEYPTFTVWERGVWIIIIIIAGQFGP